MVNVTKIDMFGWDTAFAIPYDQANAAIKKAKSTPKSFDYTSTGGLVHIQGEWDDWQIVEGGDGQNLNLKCPVKSGTISSGDETGDLSGGWLTIQIKLQDIPDPAARFDDPTGEKDGTPTAIKPKTSGTETDPAVVTISYNFPKVKGLLGLALPSVFAAYLSANLGLFNHTFSVLLVDERAAKGNFQWLKPTDVSYACADASDHSPEKSVFAVLAMTQNNPVGGNQHAIDNRILQTLPTGTNSAFAISPRQVLKHIFAPGATYVIQGSNMQDFHITNDDMTIKNHDGINWGHFKLQDGKKVKPHIKAGNFQMSLEANQVSLQIIDAHFDWSPGIEVLMTLNQFFQFDIKKNSKGLYVFLPKPGNTVRSVTASVHTSRVLNIVDIAVGIAGSLAGGLLGGFAGAWFDASGSVATSSATDAVITITEEEVAEGFDSLSEVEEEEFEQETADEVLDTVRNPSRVQRWGGAIYGNKWKILVGSLGTLIGAQPGLISEYLVLAAKDELDKIPPFNHFAANCVGAVKWPETQGWDLKSANLQGPLVIGGELTG